MVYVGMYLSSR